MKGRMEGWKDGRLQGLIHLSPLAGVLRIVEGTPTEPGVRREQCQGLPHRVCILPTFHSSTLPDRERPAIGALKPVFAHMYCGGPV